MGKVGRFVLLALLLAGPWLNATALRAYAQSAQPTPAAAPTAATPTPDPVAELMARLTPEQKIGQLFLASFGGSDTGADSDITRLIRDQHIGGVVLLAANNNFVNNADTPTRVARLTNDLQALALENNAGLPLFVAADHEGDGSPYTRITGGMTPLPNAMAIGATWDPQNASAVGALTGRELAALGVNLLLGPDVDVLNNPRPGGRGDIGTRTFGGDPWWVAQMGRSYICGVHQGSNGRVATVAKHFPGHGGSDRLPDDEVATVDKSLTELERIELPPFFAVAQPQGADDCAVTEAMMTSHIRYRGLQGNIRQFTAPISFDAESMNSILSLPELSTWRDDGLIVSDSLGVDAVARNFDPTERTFPHRQIAKEALMAGNDLLTISEFSRPRAGTLQTANLVDTVAYFRDEYRDNTAFRARVEDAVARILRVKLKIYQGHFEASSVQVDAAAAQAAVGQGTATATKIANAGLTLVYPTSGPRPAPPRRDENILIFTDADKVKDCVADDCPWYEPLALTAVQDTILRLYGPGGSGQIDPARVHSASFADLKSYLAQRVQAGSPISPTATVVPPKVDVTGLLDSAQWIIFAMRTPDPDSTSGAVRLFLDNGLTRADTRLVVLAFNAPYYLDTTEIDKLALYLAAYSKMPAAVEAAVRGVFGELAPAGHSPVNIEGTNYDLLRQLSADPDRPFGLALLEPAAGASPQPPVTVRLRAGPLLDRNGNRVPDGTDVEFNAAYNAGGPFVPAAHAGTINGVAEAGFVLYQPGEVRLTARSGDATQASMLRVSIAAPPTVPPSPTTVATATLTPEPTATPSPTIQPSPTPTPTATPGPMVRVSRRVAGPQGLSFLLALLATGLGMLAGFAMLRVARTDPERYLRWGLVCLSGGMAGYIVYVLVLAGSRPLPLVAAGVALLGSLAVVPLGRGPRNTT